MALSRVDPSPVGFCFGADNLDLDLDEAALMRADCLIGLLEGPATG